MKQAGVWLATVALAAAGTIPVGSQSITERAIYPGEDIQRIVAASPVGSRFLLKAGIHRRQAIRPKEAMVFTGETGAVLDGEYAVAHAFQALNAVRGVVIRNLVIQRYAPSNLGGAIHGDDGRDWMVDANHIRDNGGVGLRVGPGFQVLRNRVYRNAVIGISGYRADNVLVRRNRVYENNILQAAEEPGRASAAGMKFLRCHNLRIRGNTVYDNYAKGIWSDTNYPVVVIEQNVVVNNSRGGIWHEAGYDAIIRDNRVERNGGPVRGSWLGSAGIQVTNAPNVQIYGNTVTNNANGIGVMYTSGYPDGPYGPLQVRNLLVRDNIVTMTIGRTGLAQNVGDRRVYTEWNNRFANNTYYLGTNSTYFLWDERALDERGWRATGNDVTGVFVRMQ